MLLFGIAPAVATSRSERADVLRAGTRQGLAPRSRRATEILVGAQIALAVLVLSAAALIARSLVRLERAPLSIEPSHLLIGELALRGDEFETREKTLIMMDRLLHNVESVAGVRSVSTTVAVPFSGPGGWDGQFITDGQSARDASTNPVLNMELVTPSYFGTVGMPIVRGRGFTAADRDGTLPVAIVSQSTARAYWPNEDPIGKHLRLDDKTKRVLTIIGVVPDARYRDLRQARPSIYFPLAQPMLDFIGTTLVIRTIGEPAGVISAVRRAVAETSSGVSLISAEPFEWYMEGPLAQPRLDALLLAVFAGAAVILASVGLFGVMMTMVRQRTRELGVRLALGADARDVQRLVVGRGLAIAALGVGVGLVAALGVNRLLSSLLFEVSPTDPATLALVALLLLIVAAAASLVPARATAHIDPAIALRADD
jgi:putative ABC transport system permease protein